MKILFTASIMFLLSIGSSGQDTIKKALDFISKTNAKKTANSKDILTTLYRAGLDNLLGKEHKFSFSSTFWGIDSIFRNSDKNPVGFDRQRFLRTTSVNLSVTGDSINNIAKIGGGFSIVLYDGKDIKYKKFAAFYRTSKARINLSHEVEINNAIKKSIKNIIAEDDRANANSSIDAFNDSWNKADQDDDFSTLAPFIFELLKDRRLFIKVKAELATGGITDGDINSAILLLQEGKNSLNNAFDTLSKLSARKPLWTFTPDITYDRVEKQATYSFATEFVVGIGRNVEKKPWELEIKSQYKIQRDTSVKATNYGSKPFFVSVGANKVLVENKEKESQMELKFFAQYDRQFGKVPTGEKQQLLTFNSTFRVKVFRSLWLPVTIKYDPENGRVFGLFSITANIGD
jgi:hypothetical protein